MLENLILDTRREFETFRFQTASRVTDFRGFAKEVISTILDYIDDATNGEDKLQEFIDTVEEVAASEGVEPQDVQRIRDACIELAEAIFAHLRDIGAYDEQGHIGFKFKELLGNDIVLQPLEPEDFGIPVEDDDLLLPDDPEAVRAITATAEKNDLANLYAEVAEGGDDDDEPNYIED